MPRNLPCQDGDGNYTTQQDTAWTRLCERGLINKVIARSFSDAAIFILKSYCRKRKIATGYAPLGALYGALAMTFVYI
jgi:hypothetical protein